MPKDKFTATWVSHSSLTDFINCPRSYYLKNVYRNPKTNRKIQLVSPPLALGSVVHEVLEGLSVLPTKTRFNDPLLPKYELAWQKFTGKKGGFFDPELEYRYKSRGQAMLKRVSEHPGPLLNLAVKIDKDLPYYWLSEDDNIILCGKIDWLEYLPEQDAVHIIDFKTSKSEENPKSFQLPIYHLLVTNCQKRRVANASYWYLEISDELTPKTLPDLQESAKRILKIAKEIKLAKSLERFKCPNEDSCRFCAPYQQIINDKAEFVGVNDFGQEMYVIEKKDEDQDESYFI